MSSPTNHNRLPSGFRIRGTVHTDANQGQRGFQITFANGYTVSVQFGTFNYCDSPRSLKDRNLEGWLNDTCLNAEVAIIAPDGSFVRFEQKEDDVRGYTDPDTLAKIIAWVVAK